jgi:hypothetical protein
MAPLARNLYPSRLMALVEYPAGAGTPVPSLRYANNVIDPGREALVASTSTPQG